WRGWLSRVRLGLLLGWRLSSPCVAALVRSRLPLVGFGAVGRLESAWVLLGGLLSGGLPFFYGVLSGWRRALDVSLSRNTS
ncbi:MAG: hypothetical protein HC866_27150, partial [Leptolyngbyaceae cyanobacterium RU_5_1]|nr:hypothetical protein [Leptolyngbyaceae cyanobacterium RU_5_1]